MKIVREGLKPDKQLYIHQCDKCKSIFTFTKSEIKFCSDYRDDCGHHYESKCPCCDSLVYLEILKAVPNNDQWHIDQFVIECDVK